MKLRSVTFAFIFLSSMTAVCIAADAGHGKEINAAVENSLALIQASTAEYREQRTCFSCHHQAMPVIALAEARKRGFEIDEKNFKAQIERTATHLQRGKSNYEKGKGQGGKADTAGYALWALEDGDYPPDEITAAVAEYLIVWQKDDDHWSCTSNRPPSEVSDITTTYLAARALSVFGTDEQAERIAARNEAALKWLIGEKPEDTEDAVFRLRSMHYLGADAGVVTSAAKELLKSQREDGGWSQKADMESDAYATGTVLTALHEAGELSPNDDAYLLGAKFLLEQQLDDGSWHVKSRSKPFQTYFESGFPHEKDQFISIAASCWATIALMRTVDN